MTGPQQTEPPPPPTTPANPRQTRAVVATTLTASGIATIAVAIGLGIALDPLLYLVALVGVADLVFARLFASGRLGSAPSDPAGAAAAAQADPSFNPYARED